MSRNAVLAIAVVLLLIVGGWLLLRPQQPASTTQPQVTPDPVLTESAAPATATSEASVTQEENKVTITDAGFSPKEITIKAGESVVWMNEGTVDHTVNSVVHPTHLLYPPLNLNTIKPGEQKSLIFPDAGTYKYHDHLNPSLTGSVTVQ